MTTFAPATSVTTPPELLIETPSRAAFTPSASVPSIVSSVPLSTSEAAAGLTDALAGIELDAELTPTVESELDMDADGLEGLLPLSGVGKRVGAVPDTLDADCGNLMQDLGIAPDNIQKLCGEGFYAPIRELKEKFQSAIEWYVDRLNELDADEEALNALVVNPSTAPDVRARAQVGLQNLQMQRNEISEAYQALLPMNQSVSDGVDAFVEIRQQLLAALHLLKQRISEGGLDGDRVTGEERKLIEDAVLDEKITTQLGDTGAPIAESITTSVDEIIASEKGEPKEAPADEALPSLSDEPDGEDEEDEDEEEEDENIEL